MDMMCEAVIGHVVLQTSSDSAMLIHSQPFCSFARQVLIAKTMSWTMVGTWLSSSAWPVVKPIS